MAFMSDWHTRDLFEGDVALQESDASFLLNDREAVWLVESGRVDVFLIEKGRGKVGERRTHLFRVKKGHPLFGIGIDAEEEPSLLAVGNGETALLKLSRSRLKRQTQDSARAQKISGLFDNWIATLSAGIDQVAWEMAPKKHEELSIEGENLFPPDTVIRPMSRVLWVRHEEGASLFMGKKALRSLNGSILFPLSERAWLQTTEVSRLTAAETQDLIDGEEIWEGLDRFHASFMECVLLAAGAAAQAEKERLQDKARQDRLALSDAFSRLASVFEADEDELPSQKESEEPYFTVCQLIGQRLGIDVEPGPAHEGEGARRDPIGRIARASGFRTRKVALRDRWWRQDNGPLLGQVEEDGRPVALLPTSVSSYEMYDPTTGEEQPVDEAVAASLHPFAHVFYRPFPRSVLSLRDVLGFGLRGSRRDLLIVLLMGAAGGLLSMATPLATGMIFNDVIPGAERGQLLQLILALLVFAIVAALFRITRSIALIRIQGKMQASMQSAVWDRLLSLPLSFFRSYTAGDLAMRAMGVSQIQRLLSGPTITSLLGGIFSIFNFGLLYYYNVELALWATLLVTVALAVTLLGNYIQLRYQREITDLGSQISGHVLQFLTGISKLRVAGAEAKAFALWAQEFSKKRRLQFKKRRVANGVAAFNAAFPVLISLVIFALAVPLVTEEQALQIGDFLAFVAALTAFLTAVLAMSTAFARAFNAIPLYENAEPILKTLPEVDADKADPGRLRGSIEVQHVSFRYDPEGPLILQDVSLRAEPGEMVAFVGPSGSGKSTILRLLMGFEEPEAGSIYYDDQELAGLDIQAVRRQAGVVLQHGKLMPGDLFTNIVGSSMATMDDAWEAARMAGFDEDIKQMPMGLHTVVSEGGSTLSGGQRQRLMIARAVVSRPRILFFDEATSALDNKTQATVSQSLERLQATRIVVAHRLSTIMNADRIYVVEAGRIVQEGSYEELLDQEGVFAELAERQLA